MGKKKSNGTARPTQSFQQTVANATLEKFKPYIDAQIQEAGMAIAGQQRGNLENLYLRLAVLEDVVADKLEGITDDFLANAMADKQDKVEGLEKVDLVEKGDRVRCTIKTKLKDQDEFQGESRFLLDNVASDSEQSTLGPQIESTILGMRIGEEKESEIGEASIKVTVNRISRKSKEDTKEA